MDESIQKCTDKRRYSIQRKRSRELISAVGTLRYDLTIYKDKERGGYRSLLHDMLRLSDWERFTTESEALVLKNAIEESYSKAASKLKIDDQEITKTTVMDISPWSRAVIPEADEVSEKKEVEYL